MDGRKEGRTDGRTHMVFRAKYTKKKKKKKNLRQHRNQTLFQFSTSLHKRKCNICAFYEEFRVFEAWIFVRLSFRMNKKSKQVCYFIDRILTSGDGVTLNLPFTTKIVAQNRHQIFQFSLGFWILLRRDVISRHREVTYDTIKIFQKCNSFQPGTVN